MSDVDLRMRYRILAVDDVDGRAQVEVLPDHNLMVACLAVPRGYVRLWAGQPQWIDALAYALLRRDPAFIHAYAENT